MIKHRVVGLLVLELGESVTCTVPAGEGLRDYEEEITRTKEVDVVVDMVVDGYDEDDAASNAATKFAKEYSENNHPDLYDYYWKFPPTVDCLPEDIVLRLREATPLPGMEAI